MGDIRRGGHEPTSAIDEKPRRNLKFVLMRGSIYELPGETPTRTVYSSDAEEKCREQQQYHPETGVVYRVSLRGVTINRAQSSPG